MQGASEIPQFYDVLLHLGTLVAVFIAYWDEIYDMIVEFFWGRRRSRPPHDAQGRAARAAHDIARHRRHTAAFRHGAVPSFFEGLSDNMYFIGGALLFTGVLLFVSDRVRPAARSEKRPQG